MVHFTLARTQGGADGADGLTSAPAADAAIAAADTTTAAAGFSFFEGVKSHALSGADADTDDESSAAKAVGTEEFRYPSRSTLMHLAAPAGETVFARLARTYQYRSDEKSVAELCLHNANAADDVGETETGYTWRIVGELWQSRKVRLTASV
jgi:hypothetical protein